MLVQIVLGADNNHFLSEIKKNVFISNYKNNLKQFFFNEKVEDIYIQILIFLLYYTIHIR